MDKTVRNLPSVQVDDKMGGEKYIFSYKNSRLGLLHVYYDRVTIECGSNVEEVLFHDVLKLETNEDWKSDTEIGKILIYLHERVIEFTVDTMNGKFHDLPVLFRQLQRLVTSAKFTPS